MEVGVYQEILCLYWTLTWDVFKYKQLQEYGNYYANWTLTWDVFKYICWNGNRPCKIHWTLTWDVFK